MNLIKKITLERGNMPAGIGSRSITIEGDTGSVFHLQVYRTSDGRYYDFKTFAFETNYTSNSRKGNIKLGSAPLVETITFPAAASGGDTYRFQVWAEAHYDTSIIAPGKKTSHLWTKDLKHNSADSVTTFIWEYAAKQGITVLPYSGIGNLVQMTATADGTTNVVSPPTHDFARTSLTTTLAASDNGVRIKDAETHALQLSASQEGQGEKILQEFDSSVLFWQTGATTFETTNASTDSSSVSATVFLLNTVDGLYPGMYVHSIESQSHNINKSYITSIDVDTKSVTLNTTPGAWATGKDVVFNAYGKSLIQSASGISLDLKGFFKLKPHYVESRGQLTSSNNTLNIFSSAGASVGAGITGRYLEGTGGTITVSGVGQSTTVGTITLANAEFVASEDFPIEERTVYNIHGYGTTIEFDSGKLSLYRAPTTNQNIYFDLTKILTAGSNT